MTDPLIGRTIAQYEIVARIGGGAMGVVYKARDEKLGRLVALKFLPQAWSHDETAKQRFLREAQAASATNHPNICTIHDIERADDGQLFIVMAYYEGSTLKQRLESGPLPVEEALDIATQIADGLAKAHAQGVVHRDIKPGNVILTDDGVRILDFGLATFADALKLTSENSMLGTPAYMSPEQVRGQAADARSDVWAVGVVLYEMLTGHVPFQGAYAEAVAHAILHEAPEPLRSQRPDVSEEVEQLVFRALHKEANVRYPGGRELARALRQVRGLSVPLEFRTQVVVAPAIGHLQKRRRRWRTVSAVAVLVAGALAAVWWFRPITRSVVVIAPVVNQTGDVELNPYRLALMQTLERSLSESRYVRVVPHAQVVQMLQPFLREGADISSREAIQVLSANSGASIVIVPSLVYDNGALRGRAEFQSPTTAAPIGAPYLTEPAASALSKMSGAELMERLGAGIDERFRGTHWLVPSPGVQRAQFRSLEAAKAFEAGVTAYEEGEFSAARAALEEASREDAEHPLPVAWLSRVATILGDGPAAAKAAGAAAGLIENTALRSDRLFAQAVIAEARREPEMARARYQDLVEAFSDEPSWRLERAAFEDRQGRTSDAVEMYHVALGLEPRLTKAHLQLCRLYNSTRMNQAGLARKHGEIARQTYASLGAAGGEAQALLCLVDILRLGDRTQKLEAAQNARRAIEIYRRLDWPFNLARSYHYAALAAGKDNLADAAMFWEEALKGARQVGYGALEAGVVSNLGVAYQELGDRRRALDYYRQSFLSSERRGDARGAAYSRANAGGLMVQSGTDPDEGYRYLETALKVFAGVDEKFEVFCRRNLAEYYRHVGQFENADREIGRALDLARRNAFTEDVPSLLLDQARLQAEKAEYLNAKQTLARALETNAGPRTEIRIERGLVDTWLGDFDAARTALDEADRDVAAGGRSAGLASYVRAAKGVLAYESGQLAASRTEFMRALELARKDDLSDAVLVEARAYTGLIEALDGRPAAGQGAVEQCITKAQQMHRTWLDARCRVFLARISLRQQRPRDAWKSLADVRLAGLGLELKASVQHWRARASIMIGDVTAGEQYEREARQLLGALRSSLPPSDQQRLLLRPDIRAVLE